MEPMQDENGRAEFIAAVTARFLASEGLDATAADIVAAGLVSGRGKRVRPPNSWQQPDVYIRV